jgi:hypothetical protein
MLDTDGDDVAFLSGSGKTWALGRLKFILAVA